MNTKVIIAIGSAIVVFFILLIVLGSYVSYSNAEVRQRNLIVAKQRENMTQLDTTLKTISQTAQVSQEQMKSLKDIIVGAAGAERLNGGSLVAALHYAIPNVDATTFNNLQNIIVAARNSWQRNQTELLDMNRVHDDMITTWPSSMFVGSRGKIDVKIVTSGRVDQAFQTGQDNDDNVFKK